VRRWRCCGRGWWRCRSSRTAAPGGAAAVPNVRFQLFPFLPMFRSSLFLPFPLFSQSAFLSSIFFYVFLSSRFLSSFGSSSLSPLFFCFLLLLRLLPSPVLLTSALGVLFIEPRAWLCTALMGSSRLVGHWRDCQGPAPLPGFLVGARWVVGHCVRSVGSRRESGRQKFKLKQNFFLLPRCVIGGRR